VVGRDPSTDLAVVRIAGSGRWSTSSRRTRR
jgi:S1-C subfamily serine protease